MFGRHPEKFFFNISIVKLVEVKKESLEQNPILSFSYKRGKKVNSSTKTATFDATGTVTFNELIEFKGTLFRSEKPALFGKKKGVSLKKKKFSLILMGEV